MVAAFPAIKSVGLKNLLGIKWRPQSGSYGILLMLACSAVACTLAAAVAFVLSFLGAAFFVCLCDKKLYSSVKKVCAMLCSLPSVVFGLVGLVKIVPLLQRLMPELTEQSGGAMLLTVIIVLAIMLLPTVMLDCINALEHSKRRVDKASAALGATEVQTIFKAEMNEARGRLAVAAASGVRRALCEAMAVLLVSGNVVNILSLFKGVRLLSSGMVLEMGYAYATHRSALFFIGLVLMLVSVAFELLCSKNMAKD